MSSNVIAGGPFSGLLLAGFGFVYLYLILSFKCLCSGTPFLTGLSLDWIVRSKAVSHYPRLLIGSFLGLHFFYWLSSTSYVLYPAFSMLVWTSISAICLRRYEVFYGRLRPLMRSIGLRVRAFEDKIRALQWPVLDFDGLGILAVTGASLDVSQMTLRINGIDLSLQVDEHTKVIAKFENVTIRLARDIVAREIYVKFLGDGTPASAFKSFSPISRTATASSVSTRNTTDESERIVSHGSGPSPLRKVPPLPDASARPSPADTSPIPPKLPPRLPPRHSLSSAPAGVTQDDACDESEQERAELQQAIQASLEEKTSPRMPSPVGAIDSLVADETRQIHDADVSIVDVSSLHPNVSQARDSPMSASVSTTDFFYPESDDADQAELKAAFDEGAVHLTSSTEQAEHNGFGAKASRALELKDETATHKQKIDEERLKVSEILARVPWWLKITPGALVTRLLLSPLIWLHPITISSVAATGTGKRITNLMETSGLKKSHPNQEIFRLIRKVFVWLEAGDISIVLNDISVRPHIPIAADHDVRIDILAHEPTAYRNTGGTDDVLAKIHAFSASLHIPTFLLPNHEHLIPTTIRSSIPASILFSLPGVFNRELLTIGAAFIKATTMMDLRQTAQSRAPPPMPSLSGGGGQFSFKSLGLAVKQAAGDLAKQKGVQWGVRDAELAKWTAKVARLMAYIRIDVGGKGEIPVNLTKLRRRATERKLEQGHATA